MFRRFFTTGALVLTGLVPAAVEAQAIPDPVVPAGRLRLGAEGFFTRIDARATEVGSGPLDSLLSRPSAAELFPGALDLRQRLADALAGDASDFPLALGASAATLSTNQIRVAFSADVGVFDWLTVGATVPLVKSRVEGTFELAADSTADLGINPAVRTPVQVGVFIEELGTRAQEATALATQRCGAEPGSQGCLDAQALAGDLTDALAGFTGLYRASWLFPAQGTAAGSAIVTRVTGLNERLTGAGLSPVAAEVPLASSVLDRVALQEWLIDQNGDFAYLAPLGSIDGLWGLGDVEARVAVRLLDGVRTDSAGNQTGLAYKVAAFGGVRLPTGQGPEPNVALLPGRDDGQMDLMGGGYAALSTPRFALRGLARVTLQQAGEVVDRIGPPNQVLRGRRSLATVERTPGDILEVEVQPALRLAPALSVSGLWRYYRKGEDTYARVSPLPAAPTEPWRPTGPVFSDPALLAIDSEVVFQEVGGTLTYRTTRLPDAGGEGFEAYVDLRTTISTGAVGTPEGTRVAFGARILRRLWGN